MTRWMRLLLYGGGGILLLILLYIAYIKFGQRPPAPQPHHGQLAALPITLYVDGTGQCKQQVGGADNDTPTIDNGQGVTWQTGQGSAGQSWSLSFQEQALLTPNTGTPFENPPMTQWQFNFSGQGVNPAPSGPSVLTDQEQSHYANAKQVVFYYDNMVINGAQCGGVSSLGVIVKTGK